MGVNAPATAAAVTHRMLDDAESARVVDDLRAGNHAVVGIGTRTRAASSLMADDGSSFRLLRQQPVGCVLTTGPSGRLGSQLAGIPEDLEAVTGTHPTPGGWVTTADPTSLGPGDVLALAEIVRDGREDRRRTACDELELAEMPWWIKQFAWGAEAALTMTLFVDGRTQFATMLHLLSSGWGCLTADAADDLVFRPMTTLEVQARLSAFAALLQEATRGQ